MEIAQQLASRLGEACRQQASTAALGAAIAAAVFALATLIRGPAGAAGFINLCIIVVVPSVCVIAYAAALMEESVLIRGARASLLLVGLYFCLTLPAAPSFEAQHWRLPARLAQFLAALFGGALIPAVILRWAGWRLRRGQEESHLRTANRLQFGLFDLLSFITALSILLTLGATTQRIYNLRLMEFLPSSLYPEVAQRTLIAALVTGSAGLGVFCLWFAEHAARRVSLLICYFASWMLALALPCVAAIAFELASRPAEFLFGLALWVGVLFVLMTGASLIAQARGWRLAGPSAE